MRIGIRPSRKSVKFVLDSDTPEIQTSLPCCRLFSAVERADIVPFKKPANRLYLLNISRIYHKLTPLGKQNPKNLFEEVSHASLSGNPVLVRVSPNPFEKKIPSEPTSPPSQNSATNFKTENSNPYPPMKSFLFSPG